MFSNNPNFPPCLAWFYFSSVLPGGSDIVGQRGLIVRDAFAADHVDPPSLGVGHHARVDGGNAHRRGLRGAEGREEVG